MPEGTSNKELRNEIEIGQIFFFLKKCYGKIICFGLFTLAVMLVLIAAAYFLIPKKESHTSTIHLQLQRFGGYYCYPNEKKFSAGDVISTVVLSRVYEKYKLEDKMKFEDFNSLFSLGGVNMDKALLDAAFQAKLSDKKITVVDIQRLEKEYHEAIAKLNNGAVTIVMEPTTQFSSQERNKILNEIPKVWFAIYSKQEAKVFPGIETPAKIQQLRQNLERDGKLITLDKARRICSSLQLACTELEELLSGSKISLPSGEQISDVKKSLENLISLRIQPLMLIVISNLSFQQPLDQVSLQASILEIDKQIKEEEAKYEAAVSAINVISAGSNAGKIATSAAQGESAAPVNVSVDNQMLMSLETLIRQSYSIHSRERYAARAMTHKEQLAELEAEKDYYNTLMKGLDDKGHALKTLSIEQFEKLENSMFDELLEICGKINKLRDFYFEDYVLERDFFVTDGIMEKKSEFYFPFMRIALGLICLVLLSNVVYVGKMFYTELSAGNLNK